MKLLDTTVAVDHLRGEPAGFHCYRLGFTCDGPRSRLTLNAEPIQRYTVTVYEHTIRTDHIRAHP